MAYVEISSWSDIFKPEEAFSRWWFQYDSVRYMQYDLCHWNREKWLTACAAEQLVFVTIMMVIRRYDRYLYLCVWFQRYWYKIVENMVLESTIICVDNSEYTRNGDYLPTRLQAQQASYAFVFPSVGSEFILPQNRIPGTVPVLFINQDPFFLP